MSAAFTVHETNPNQPNSNGCLCSEAGTQDTKGPFIVFGSTTLDNYLAPYPVLCSGCAHECAMSITIAEGDPTVIAAMEDSEPTLSMGRTTRRKRSDDGPTI